MALATAEWREQCLVDGLRWNAVKEAALPGTMFRLPMEDSEGRPVLVLRLGQMSPADHDGLARSRGRPGGGGGMLVAYARRRRTQKMRPTCAANLLTPGFSLAQIDLLIFSMELLTRSRPEAPRGDGACLAAEQARCRRARGCASRRRCGPDAGSGVQVTLLVDCSGWAYSTSPPARNALKAISILQDHYPERLGLAVLLAPPRIFSLFWAAIAPFLAAKTAAKLRILPGGCAAACADPLADVFADPAAALTAALVSREDGLPHFDFATYDAAMAAEEAAHGAGQRTPPQCEEEPRSPARAMRKQLAQQRLEEGCRCEGDSLQEGDEGDALLLHERGERRAPTTATELPGPSDSMQAAGSPAGCAAVLQPRRRSPSSQALSSAAG